jgi:carbon storage regulator
VLVLTRKLNETIQLGDDISITVVSIDSDRVKIGIDAPRSLKIFRKELLTETAGINKEAAEAAAISFKGSLEGIKDALTKNKP